MQDGFIIDDQDPKQRGHGPDRMGSRRDGLNYLWRWINTSGDGRPLGTKSKKPRVPCQICEARLPRMKGLPGEPYIRLEVIFWHTNYEARLRIRDSNVVSSEGFQTRLGAQRVAENMVDRLATAIRKSGA